MSCPALVIEHLRVDFPDVIAVNAVLEIPRDRIQRSRLLQSEDAELLRPYMRQVIEADRGAGWFEVWLIPETLRMTTFGDKRAGDALHIEIERSTQVFVDTVRDAVDERLGPLRPALEALLRERGIELDELAEPARLPRA